MRRSLRLLGVAVIAAMALVVPGTAVAADAVPVETLLEDPEAFAGEQVVRGELVADYGFRKDGWVWTQLNDDAYATDPILEGGALAGGNTGIGVRMRAALAEGLDAPGGYRTRGPLVELTGTWVFHDPDRGGESYFEVASLEVVEPGRTLREDVHWLRIVLGGALLAAAGVLWLRRSRQE